MLRLGHFAPLACLHLLAISADPSSSSSPCLGEYVQDSSGECVLRANDGYPDEPTASMSWCTPTQFACPDGSRCASTAMEYAQCATGLSSDASLFSIESLCNISGSWHCGGVDCKIAQQGNSFDVKAVGAGSTWHSGHAKIVSSGAYMRVSLILDMGSGHQARKEGTIGARCGSITWNDTSVWTCSGCPAETRMLDVHIIAHSHDDTGYLSTVEEYYESNVRHILDTVTQELQNNPARRFTFVEIAFFAKWWEQQTSKTKDIVRRLVAEGQLDFSNGGWCMPDEGAPSYQDLLANMQKGLRFIQREFGQDARPRVAWSIDPFGHSSTYATLNAMFGFDFFVVGRIDFQEKAARFQTLSMETVWRPSRSAAGTSRDIFTHVLDPLQFYSYPPGFAFEGDRRTWINETNVESRAGEFATFIRKKSAGYASDSLLVPFGSDFQYTNATINYVNMDKLMAHMNTPENQMKYGMRLQYSTPTYYMKTLHAKDQEWPLKVDDFESYAIGPDQFLVGFYSSRPDMKGFVRSANSQLRAANVALANAIILREQPPPGIDYRTEINALNVQDDALGILQHHDAITSTQRRHVHRDYIAQLSAGQVAVDGSIARVVGATFATQDAQGTGSLALTTCPYLNESTCAATTSNSSEILILLQNPTGQPIVGAPVRIPVLGPVAVRDGSSKPVEVQLLGKWPASPFVHNETLVEPSPTAVFLADVPALGVAAYSLQRSTDASSSVPEYRHDPSSELVLDNGILRVTFDTHGLLASIQKGNITVKAKQTLQYYRASDGKPGPSNPYGPAGATGSGNYIFQPNGTETHNFTASGAPLTVTYVNGSVVSEVRHVFVERSLEQVFRLHRNSDVLEIEYRLGPIDVSDGIGKEVITRFETDVKSGDVWYSDVNGLQIDARKRNSRATLWPGGPEYFNQTDVVAGNYFAANTQAFIADGADTKAGQRRFTVLTDRSEGASSLSSGALELMLHRRLTHGCRWGMCENNSDDGGKMENAGLNDTLGAEVVVKHWLSVDRQEADGSSPAVTRARARQLNYPPSALFHQQATKLTSLVATGSSPLLTPLPENLDITTWQVLEDGSALLRITHMYMVGEHPTLSKPATVDICQVFGSHFCARLVKFVEMNAAGDVPIETVHRLQWRVKGEMAPSASPRAASPSLGEKMLVTIDPSDTRTFNLVTSDSGEIYI